MHPFLVSQSISCDFIVCKFVHWFIYTNTYYIELQILKIFGYVVSAARDLLLLYRFARTYSTSLEALIFVKKKRERTYVHVRYYLKSKRNVVHMHEIISINKIINVSSVARLRLAK